METHNLHMEDNMQAIEMDAQVNDNHEIKLKLPGTIKHGMVKVIVMYDDATDIASAVKKRQFGQFKGKIKISDDFNDALPDTFWAGTER